MADPLVRCQRQHPPWTLGASKAVRRAWRVWYVRRVWRPSQRTMMLQVRTATMEILPEGKSRPQVIAYPVAQMHDAQDSVRLVSADVLVAQIQREIRAKEHAVKQLSRRYSCRGFSEDEVQLCLYSVADNFAYLRYNHDPIEKMIQHLETLFHPGNAVEGYSLAVTAVVREQCAHTGILHMWLVWLIACVSQDDAGSDGARLTHKHDRQYAYVMQSLKLWSAISFDMFELWTTGVVPTTIPHRHTGDHYS